MKSRKVVHRSPPNNLIQNLQTLMNSSHNNVVNPEMATIDLSTENRGTENHCIGISEKISTDFHTRAR